MALGSPSANNQIKGNKMSIEITSQEIQEAMDLLAVITGATTTDEQLNILSTKDQ